MPYLSFDLDAKKRVSRVARAVGVEPGHIAWGLMELWEHTWTTKKDTHGEMILDGCFGPSQRIRDALVVYDFLEIVDGGWRVRGAAKYLKVRSSQSAAGRKRAAGERNELGQLVASSSWIPSPALDQPLHPTPNTQHPNTSFAGNQPPAAKKPRARKEKPPDPRHTPLKAALERVYMERVGEAWTFDGSDAKAIGGLLAKAPEAEIVLRWSRALVAKFHACRRPRELLAKWGHHGDPPTRAAGGREGELFSSEPSCKAI